MDVKCKNCGKDFELFTSDFCCEQCAEDYFVHPKWEIMEEVCMHCGNVFDGNKEKFCSGACRTSHMMIIKKRIREAMNNDPSYARRFSRD